MTMAHTIQQSSLKYRSSSLDLIKWMAMLTMVIDHLRLVWPEMSNLFIPARPVLCRHCGQRSALQSGRIADCRE